MIEINKQCRRCFHFEVCANVMKNQLYIREKMMKQENPKCKHYVPYKICEITEKTYVDREAFYEKLNDMSKWEHGDYNRAINDCMNALDDFPQADVAEVRDCEKCLHFGKTNSQYPCSHCRNCYTDKFENIEIKGGN